MAEDYLDFDQEFFFLQPEEEGSERNAVTAAVAGIASGLIKVPEGVVSLGAQLIDLGAGTNTAADVEEFFDKLNPFEEIAGERAVGRLTEALVQVGIPGGVGFKLATNMANKALTAKKAGNYLNLKRPDLLKGAKKAQQLNRNAKLKRFAAGVAGGAAGETLVTDVENIGAFGDLFTNDTWLDREDLADPRKDAGRQLLNRIKFAGESLVVTPFVYGALRGIKEAATIGKNIEFSDSSLSRFFNKTFSALRARGAKPQKIFEEKMAEKAATMSDANRAMELVRKIDGNVNKMFPFFKDMASRSAAKEKASILKQMNDAMFTGDLSKPMSDKVVKDLSKTFSTKGLDKNRSNLLIGTLNNARKEFTNLIAASSNAPADVKTLSGLLGNRYKDYLGGYYKIFEEKSLIPFLNYKPTDEAFQNARELFVRYAAKAGKPFESINQVDEQIKRIIESAIAAKKPNSLPFFKYTNKTPEVDGTLTKKFFKQVLAKDAEGNTLKGADRAAALRGQKKGATIEPIGEGSKIFRELFGRLEDPRFSIYNGMTRLSTVARKNQLFQRLDDADYARKQEVQGIEAAGGVVPAGTKGFFFATRDAAEQNLPFQKIVSLDDYVAPAFKDDYAVNPLAGQFTSQDIASALGDSQKILKFLFEARPDATGVEKLATWGYRNLILFPKAASQVAKTILAPVTHFRNLFSATGFSAANGIFFENPKVVGQAFREAFGTVQLPGRRGIGDNSRVLSDERYRKLLRLGVVNSQPNVNDFRNLLQDVGFGSRLNFEKPLESMGKKLLGSGVRGAKAFMKGAEDLYTAEDDLFKMANFAVERYRLKKLIPNATEEFLDNEAADIVRNTVPNYAYVSDTVRALRRLPLGTFMSFPSEILRTTTNIAQRALKEIRDPTTGKINPFTSENPLKSVGIKRLIGLSTVLAAAPYGIQKGFQALYDVTNEELDAIKRYLPKWSKNSTILPIRDEESGELKYIDFSHGNAYDVAIRPIQTLLNNIQQGIEDEDILLRGFVRGISQAAGELAEPFVSESIYTEALTDLTLRGGVTQDGRRLYTDQTPLGDKIKIGTDHLAEALMPFSYPQLTRLYEAALDKPSGRGEFFELPDELLGLAGYRAVRLDPVRAMGFKIAGYQKGIRESRGLFTGGGLGDSLLSGGPKTPMEVIERYIKANEAKFNVQKDMAKNIVAADLLGADEDEIRKEFIDRNLRSTYTDLINDRFDPYYPSRAIIKEFESIAENIGEENPFEEVEDIIDDIRDDLRDLSLTDSFDINISDYATEDMFSENIVTPPLPEQVTSAQPNPQVIQTAQVAPMTQQGLTPSEQALLSEEEKQIRLRQRGLIT